MELDLDSFLDSHLDSDSDSDDHINSVPRRTVDEILLNDDSDSSSPPSPTPSSQTLKPPNPLLLQPKLTPQLVPAQLTPDPLPRPPPPPSRPLPSLFAGVRSNAKPGAALAAAAAASLSVPTPHAAAIKSRRAKVFDSGESGSTVDNDELGSNSGGDSIVEVGFEINRLEDRLVEDEENLGNLQSDPSNVGGEFSRHDGILDSSREECGQELTTSNDGAAAAERVSEQVDESRVSNSDEALLDTSSTSMLYSNAESRIDVEESLNFNKNSSSSGLDDVRDLNAAPASAENASFVENVVSSFPGFDMDENIDEELTIPELGTQGLEKGISYSENNEVGLGVVDGTTSSTSQVSELVEERLGQLESKRISKRAEKKSRPSLKTLELADELEKKHASTGLHWEEGAAAQPMRLEGVRRGSITLGYFDVDANNTITRTISSQAFRRDHGSPQVLAVHLNYIAVGMSKGVTVVVPSKYNAQHTEIMDGKMLMLGLQGDRSHAPVTSLSFNQQGDLLLAGYGDGHVTVWDVQRVSAAKVITGEHTAPVVHALFLGQDSQVTRQFKAVTGDSKGLVLLHAFSVVPLLNRFSIKTQCLLDGQRTGTVLSASPLLFDDSSGGASLSSQGNTTVSTSSIGSMMGGVVGGDAGWKLFNEGSSLVEEGVVIFVTHQTVLVVRLTPKLEVYAQLSKPVGVREGSMPYTAWKCMPPSHGSSTEAAERVSLLAIAWDRKVQVAKLVKSEVNVYGTWSLDSAAIGVSWLDDQMLVVLTLTGQLYLFAKDGTIIHQTSFAIDGSGGDDLIAYHTYFSNIFGNPEKAYHNSVAVRGASIYILGPIHLVVSRLLPWKERIEVLRKAGDWMGALNMAMSLYDGQAHGVIDLPRTLDAVQEVIMPYLVELLMAYVDEVFSYISVAFCNQIGKGEPLDDPKSRSSSVHSEIKEQFTRVGGVSVEFCVHIKRTDILFDEIFSKFVAVQQRDTFLELLEPYILRDMLGSLPPEIMQALVEHYSSKGWLQRVEQCVLHMDISSLDFNQVVRLCREHGLYGALVYLFNKGLDDYRAPLEELLVVFRNSQGENASTPGYRMLVYLKYCFSGLAFPPGRGALPPTRLPSLRKELLQFLLENSVALNSRAVSTVSFRGPYLNLHHLLELDTEATLDVLRCAFVEDQIPKPDLSLLDSPEANIEAEKENNSMAESQNHLIQDTINALIHTLENNIFRTDRSASNNDAEPIEAWPPKKDVGHLFEFIAYYVACGRAKVSKNVLSQILEYLTLENTYPTSIFTHNTGALKIREKQVLALLKVVPETDWNASYVLHLCENAQFYQVCGLIYTIRKQYHAALDSYIKDVDEPIHAFSFINSMLLQLNDTECAAFQSAVISRISELVELSREGAFLLVIDHFKKENLQILSELRSHPKSLFLYLKTVIEVHLSGTLNFSCLTKDYMLDVPNGMLVKDHPEGLEAYFKKISDLPKFLRNNPIDVTDEMIELYLELLCQYERNSVLKFLETFESYRVEHCLRLCQEYGIIDAAAFLLERVGDVGSALLLTLSSLNDKLFELDTAVGSIIPNADLCSSAGMEYFSSVLKLKELSDIQDILHTCIGLCQRNTPRLNPEESETLWFRVLDSFCEPLTDSSCNDKMISEGYNYVGILAESLASKEIEEESIIKYRISKSHGGAYVLRKLFSQFIKEIVQGMIGYVHLPTIMSKLLSDNGGQEFGDFKLTILGMLGTYDFERKILDTAMSLIEDDAFYTVNLLKKGASHGYAPQSVICCICSCVFTKNSSSSGIRVFNCGHATHLQCELLENEASSRGSLSGCPVCMPKKTTQKSRNKSVLQENGLVNKFSSRSHQAQGTNVLHPHESDGFENAYGLQQISRFEMLNNLQKNSSLIQIVNMPQLKLAPPAVYHEKVKKRSGILSGESSSGLTEVEKSSKNRQPREQRVKGSSLRIPLKTSIFGRDWTSRR